MSKKIISIGFRAEKEKVTYAIYEDEKLYLDEILLPISLSEPEQLSFLRNTLLDIIKQQKVTNASFKKIEDASTKMKGSIDIKRIQNESIIKEVLYSSGIDNYKIITKKYLANKFEVKNNIVSQIINGKRTGKTTQAEFESVINEAENKIKDLSMVKNYIKREAVISAFFALYGDEVNE